MLSIEAFPYYSCRYAQHSKKAENLGIQYGQCITGLTRLHAQTRASTSPVLGTLHTAFFAYSEFMFSVTGPFLRRQRRLSARKRDRSAYTTERVQKEPEKHP